MRLKRIKLFGFKTFADKTEFDLDGDLIAVVGPNGCGKSNLVDAILWGLGEGSVKNLRAGSSQDVIFNGSARRKAVGYAEVTLHFDNEDGALPLDSAEVAITRRLARGGDSEYFINRRHCRLRDVLDLLADSGLGRAGYAIIGQRDIDQALAASPEDRRSWVDEAAGVQRYRARKVEALRRLDSAKQHLTRVTDILQEVESQREPMRAEAEAASAYKSLQASLREVESGLLIFEFAKADSEAAQFEARRIEASSRLESESARVQDLERKADEATSEAAAKDRSLEVERQRLQSAIADFERSASSVKLLQQRLASLDELESSIGDDTDADRMRCVEAEAELAESQAEAEMCEKALAQVRIDCAGAGDEAKELAKALSLAEKLLADGRLLMDQCMKHDAEAAHRSARAAQVRLEIEQAEVALPEVEKAIEEAVASAEACEAQRGRLVDELTVLRAASQALGEKISQQAAAMREALSARAELEGRRSGIESTIAAHEGLSEGARAVLEAVDRGLLTGKFLPLGESIRVMPEHAAAVEAALGHAVHDLLAESTLRGVEALQLLDGERLGKASIWPSEELSQEAGATLAAPDTATPILAFVEADEAFRRPLEHILRDAYLVETLDVAQSLARAHRAGTWVTPTGQVVHGSGRISGGRSAASRQGLVQRSADLSEIVASLAGLEESIALTETTLRELEVARQEQASRLDAMGAMLRSAEAEVANAQSWVRRITDERDSTQRSIDKLVSELKSLTQTSEGPGERPDIEGLQGERDRVFALLAARSADVESSKEKIRAAEERHAAAVQRLRQAERRLSLLRASEEQRTLRLLSIEPERDRLRAEMDAAGRAEKDSSARRTDCTAAVEALQLAKEGAEERAATLRSEVKDLRTAVQGLTESAHQAELARARADGRRAATQQRLLEEYGIGAEEALRLAPTTEVPRDAQALVGRLRRELRALGDVNLGAIEAFERLSTRADELQSQSDDIRAGMGEVEASIAELDSLTRDRFLDTFARLQEAFEATFGLLFEGGEGRISLADPDRVLESGIDIDVALPGKKRQRLELLSGGERSLCATAFLFALLKVKPSPLVILDEVDAPLDGRNVERYIALLKDFAGPIQFILITHNPSTIEAAPVWLGVTMQEPGVSTLVPATARANAPQSAVVHVNGDAAVISV